MILHRSEMLNNEVEPIDRFWFTDEINEIPGMLNLIDPEKRQISSRLTAPTIQDNDGEDIKKNPVLPPPATMAFQFDEKKYILMMIAVSVLVVLFIKKKYATLGIISLLLFLKFSVGIAT